MLKLFCLTFVTTDFVYLCRWSRLRLARALRVKHNWWYIFNLSTSTDELVVPKKPNGFAFSFLAPWKFSHLSSHCNFPPTENYYLYHPVLPHGYSELAPTHQCTSWTVLSIGWDVFLHPVPDPVLTQHCTTQLFWAADLLPFYLFFGCFFFPILTLLTSRVWVLWNHLI